MSYLQQEQMISCPFCGEQISVLIDTSAGTQQYIEDCQVCCQPIEFSVLVEMDEIVSVVVKSDQE